MNGKLDQALGAQSAALQLRVQRQQMLASNIANADTPGYKAVDFNFAGALRAALGQTAPASSAGASASASVQPAAAPPAGVQARTAAGHQAGTRSAYAGLSTQYRMPAQPAADGNSVDMDLERTRFAENAVRYEASLRFLNGQVKTMLSAIQG
ncbi:MAG: flagellar basal body rod protein FlgB [Betaproteobacteria bacterium]|jgi:flagellar basal-body rod protein FlgB|nr:flagellar basal body rod protein FlgB [Betaproteobacteria bacterium]